jgi:hypothetical protein
MIGLPNPLPEFHIIMKTRIVVTAVWLAIASAGAVAGPGETANVAKAKVSKVAVKVKGAVRHGAEKAAGGVAHGAAVAAKAVNNTAGKLGLPASTASATRR